jgi:hypothetical protein
LLGDDAAVGIEELEMLFCIVEGEVVSRMIDPAEVSSEVVDVMMKEEVVESRVKVGIDTDVVEIDASAVVSCVVVFAAASVVIDDGFDVEEVEIVAS